MNQKDVKTLGLHAGDKVDLVSEAGSMKAVTVSPFDVPPGNLLAYFPEANCLVGTEVDPRSKTPAFKSVPVTIQAVAR